MRLFITTLSMLSVFSFGYALAGYGRGLLGMPLRFDYIIGGLTGGFFFGGLAMFLWYKKRDEFFEENNINDEI